MTRSSGRSNRPLFTPVAGLALVLCACNGGGEPAPRDQGGADGLETGLDAVSADLRTVVKLGRLCSSDGWCLARRFDGGGKISGIWGSGPTDLYVIESRGCCPFYPQKDYSRIHHFDGTNWVVADSDEGWIGGVWGGGPDRIFAAGEGVLMFNGTVWSRTTWNFGRALWGTAEEVYHGGCDGWPNVKSGSVRRYDGKYWSVRYKLPSGQCPLAMWGSGPEDLFVAGQEGAIVHYDGVFWNLHDSGTTADLNAVWGSGPSDVYAVGAAGAVVRYDGSQWREASSMTQADLFGIWGSGPEDLYVVGAEGTILHFDGQSWSQMSSPVDDDLLAVWGSGVDEAVVAGGEEGALLRYVP